MNDLKDYSILIIDDSPLIRQVIGTYLGEDGANVLTAIHGGEALDICKNQKVDLLVLDINMPVMDGFELLDQLNTISVKIPSIMITHTDIDSFIEMAIERDVGNILSKPINKRELIDLCRKILTGKDIFGLENYLDQAQDMKNLDIRSTVAIHPAIEEIVKYGVDSGMTASKSTFLSIIIDEVLSNAVYHAHGLTHLKLEAKPATLPESDRVEVCYSHDLATLGISVTDFKGTLTKKKILNSFKEVVDQQKLIEQAEATGMDVSSKITSTGRGLQMIRLMSNRYYFNIKPGVMTQVIILVDLKETEARTGYSSIKINEVF
jgi:CheY-like chemotaxis protein